MQDLNQSQDLFQEYHDGIRASFEQHSIFEHHLKTIDRASRTPQDANKSNMIIKTNYIAILLLEKLGFMTPEQSQIDVMEKLVVHSQETGCLDNKILEICMGSNSRVRKTLLQELNRKVDLLLQK